jgi:mono/diheme cytochrome c family protein
MRSVVGTMAFALVVVQGLATAAQAASVQKGELERGRYLVKIGGCNDCHTAGWPETAGAVPEAEWLTGVGVGFQGPWGTTYPSNLRIVLGGMTEAQWMASARKPLKPPMPWFALRDMTNGDLRAIYRFVKSLGPAGKPAPQYVPPGGTVTTPVIVFPPPPPSAPAPVKPAR